MKKYKEGLVCGKFEVLHKGHMALIDFARKRCEKLNILLSSNKEEEKIPGEIRLKWLRDSYRDCPDINIDYTDIDLPYTSVSNKEIASVWSEFFKKLYPNLSVIFTSEKYGNYVAEYMNIKHIIFDEKRINIPVSSTKIINNPTTYWEFISDTAKPYFVRKIVLFGTESTGKSTLTERLADKFLTNCVLEKSREIMDNTDNCTYNDLFTLARNHANNINKSIFLSNKFIFIDTNIETIKVYSEYLFNEKILHFDKWIIDANKTDLYLYLDRDAPYIQDGTRLVVERRNELGKLQLEHLKKINADFEIINGFDWEKRYQKAVNIVEKKLKESLW